MAILQQECLSFVFSPEPASGSEITQMVKKKSDWDSFVLLTRDPYFAGLVVWLILTIAWLVSLIPGLSEVWILIWSPTPAFLMFDYLTSRIARGGSGIFQNPITGRTMHKGHGILVMFLVILVATVVTDALILLFSELHPSITLAIAPIANAIVAIWLGLWVDNQYYH